MKATRNNSSAFTIVELLIVIVVIAILAAISVVAFTGIQQRATNTKIISAANQVVKTISGYIASTGAYPLTTNGTFCIVPSDDAACASFSASRSIDTTLMNNLATIGTLPSPTPSIATDWTGIAYNFSSTYYYDGVLQPARVTYSLKGAYQQCGLANVANTGGAVMTPSTTGYTSSGTSYTICVISVPGP